MNSNNDTSLELSLRPGKSPGSSLTMFALGDSITLFGCDVDDDVDDDLDAPTSTNNLVFVAAAAIRGSASAPTFSWMPSKDQWGWGQYYKQSNYRSANRV